MSSLVPYNPNLRHRNNQYNESSYDLNLTSYGGNSMPDVTSSLRVNSHAFLENPTNKATFLNQDDLPKLKEVKLDFNIPAKITVLKYPNGEERHILYDEENLIPEPSNEIDQQNESQIGQRKSFRDIQPGSMIYNIESPYIYGELVCQSGFPAQFIRFKEDGSAIVLMPSGDVRFLDKNSKATIHDACSKIPELVPTTLKSIPKRISPLSGHISKSTLEKSGTPVLKQRFSEYKENIDNRRINDFPEIPKTIVSQPSPSPIPESSPKSGWEINRNSIPSFSFPKVDLHKFLEQPINQEESIDQDKLPEIPKNTFKPIALELEPKEEPIPEQGTKRRWKQVVKVVAVVGLAILGCFLIDDIVKGRTISFPGSFSNSSNANASLVLSNTQCNITLKDNHQHIVLGKCTDEEIDDAFDKFNKKIEESQEIHDKQLKEETKRELDELRKEHQANREATAARSKELDERIRKLTNPTPEEKAQAQKEAEIKGLENFEKEFEEIFGRNAPPLQKPIDCAVLDPESYKSSSDFERILSEKLNPLCEEHAKIILTQKDKEFDEKLYKDKGCAHIRSIFRNVSLVTHPDKNLDEKELATEALRIAKAAAKTLCNP